MSELPLIVRKAWQVINPGQIESSANLSRNVSTNSVYRIVYDGGKTLICKVSGYGTFEHFLEDHMALIDWRQAMAGTRFENLLAEPIAENNHFYAYTHDGTWVSFYRELESTHMLPAILSDTQIKCLAREMAELHHITEEKSMPHMEPAKSLESDTMVLWRSLDNEYYIDHLGLKVKEADFLKKQCETLLNNLEKLHYHKLHRMPVLVDWNLGNFGVDKTEGDFTMLGRWDYDWFRFEPSVMDFYFLSRVVRSEGDKTDFSYVPYHLVEDRFILFLSEYTKIRQLPIEEYRFMREAYRFFILNYVIKDGQNFFRADIYRRLRDEVVEFYLSHLDEIKLEDKNILSQIKLA